MIDTYENLKDKLNKIECKQDHLHNDYKVNLIKCAILILMVKKEDKLHVLFTVRSQRLKSYSGEICFPGGKFDPNLDETFEDTAVRETNEEIGLLKQDIKIICKLCPFPTIVGHLIVPVIGLYTNTYEHLVQHLLANPDEVQSIFTIPFDYFGVNLNNQSVFQLMHESFDCNFFKDINLSKYFSMNEKQIPKDFYRLFISFDESVFQPIQGTYSYIYGFNSFILLLIILSINNDWELKTDEITLNHLNIFNFIHNIRKCSYLLYLKQLKIKSKI
jgi:8-oxo-dGTP pyrophosphatase MutT (NUDIX family)